MYYPRKIFDHLAAHATKKQVSIITGMRRTGKTTIIRQLLSVILNDNSIYIDLERMDNRQLFMELNYETVIMALKQRGLDFNKKCVIALDEAQLVKGLPSVVKYLYDIYNIKFIISGSSSYYLRDLFSESFSGRKKNFEIFPLDFGEYLTFKSIPWKETEFLKHPFDINEFNRVKSWYDEYIEFGGFPEVVLNDQISDKKDILDDLVSSYINGDIKWLSDFRKAENIRNLMAMLASRTGTKLDISKVSALTGLSIPTVTKYIELFEQTYLIHRVPVISKNPDREIVKAKKLFFSDNGIVNRLAKVSSGSQFENAVFNQLKHKGKINYYSLKNGLEIDFVLNDTISIEAKETATMADFQLLRKLSSNLKINKSYIVSKYPSANFPDSIWGGCIR